jgi:hypothetical protein
MGSVGSGTVIENVMCSFGLDDSFEWFGGTVNCKNLIAYSGLDDDLDVDNGFSGKVQFALCIREKNRADQSKSNGFEVDNDGSGSAATPTTSGTFSNITVVGPKTTETTEINALFGTAAHLRRSNKLKIHNSVFTGYPNGILIDGGGTTTNASKGELVLKNVFLAGVGSKAFGVTITAKDAVDGFKVEEWFLAAENKNRKFTTYEEAGLSSGIFSGFSGKPTVLPTSGSPLLTGADFTGLTGFQSVQFVGAFGTSDWTSGWAEWNPQNKVYYGE